MPKQNGDRTLGTQVKLFVFSEGAGSVAKKKYAILSQIRALPPTVYTELPWFQSLSPGEQRVIQREGKELADAILVHGQSRLAIGEHLANIQDVLEKHGAFGKFLSQFHFSRRTAYRMISGFRHASEMLPETVVKSAMKRGMNLLGASEEKPLGIYTDAVKALPPPEKASPQQAELYLDQLEATKKEVQKQNPGFGKIEPLAACKDTFVRFKNNYRRIDGNKARINFLHKLVGMMMTQAGLSSPQTFEPEAIPEDFRKPRGYPKGRPRNDS